VNAAPQEAADACQPEGCHQTASGRALSGKRAETMDNLLSIKRGETDAGQFLSRCATRDGNEGRTGAADEPPSVSRHGSP